MAMEILVPNAAIRNLIREDKIHQIYSMMQTGQSKFGMQTFNQSLATLYFKKLITLETALSRSSMPDELQELINRGAGVNVADRRRADGRQEVRDKRCRTTSGRGATATGLVQEGVLVADTKDVALASLRRQNIVVTGIRERGKEISLTKMGRKVPRQDARDLHPPVLGHDRRRPAARAVPRDPREPAGAQELPEDPPPGAPGRRGRLDARRRDAPPPEGVRRPLRQHGRRRRGGRYPRHDPPAPLDLHREGGQAALPGPVGADLPGRRHHASPRSSSRSSC